MDLGPVEDVLHPLGLVGVCRVVEAGPGTQNYVAPAGDVAQNSAVVCCTGGAVGCSIVKVIS